MNRRGRNFIRGNQTRGGRNGPGGNDNIRDLDLELELLRRKRQLLQHQQEILANDQQYNRGGNQYGYSADYSQPRNNYDQSRNSFSQPRNQQQQSSFNFADYYSDVGQNFTSGKRRFDTKQSNLGPPMKRPRNQRSNEFISPWAQNQSQSNTAIQRAKPRFRVKGGHVGQTKVSKAIVSAPVPAKSFPARPRKKPSNTNNEDVDTVLRPNKPIVPLVAGRLELALGEIMKQIREAHNFSPTPNLYRLMKQTVRERMHSAMLGKNVGKTPEITEMYRLKFPKATDIEVVNMVKDIHERTVNGPKPSKFSMEFIQADNPEKYFKANMSKLLGIRINEMFGKLGELYEKNDGELVKIVESLPDLPEKAPTETQEGEPEKAAEAEMPSQDEKEGEGKTEEENKEAEDKKEGEDKKEETKEGADPDVEIIEAPKEDAVAGTEDVDAAVAKRLDQYDKLMDILLRNKLPVILQRSKSQVLRLLNLDRMYKELRATIVQYAAAAKPSGDSTEDTTTVVPRSRPPNALPYYVRIVGKPSLPNRTVMRDFIDKFNPKSIKKHKNIYHMLFIGFDDEAMFQAILACDGEKIGHATLSIKISDRTKQYSELSAKKEEEAKANEENGVKTEGDKGPDDADVEIIEDCKGEKTENDNDIIGDELDSQIDDLLTDIKKSEEPENVQTNGDKKEDIEMVEENANNEDVTEAKGAIQEVKKEAAKGTPTRASARLSTAPSTVTTRRTSKMT